MLYVGYSKVFDSIYEFSTLHCTYYNTVITTQKKHIFLTLPWNIDNMVRRGTNSTVISKNKINIK